MVAKADSEASAGKDTSKPPDTMTMNSPMAKMPGTTSADSMSTMLLGVKNWPERTWISRHSAMNTRPM